MLCSESFSEICRAIFLHLILVELSFTWAVQKALDLLNTALQYGKPLIIRNKLISEWALSFISQHNDSWMCFQ